MTDLHQTAHKMLQVIKQDTTLTNIYQFLIDDLNEQISFHARNTLYWKNQLAYLDRHEKFRTSKEKKAAQKPYKSLIKDNKKTIKCFNKSIKSLKTAIKHTRKGDHHHVE